MNYEKNWIWNFTKWGILIFPLFPLLGGIIFGITLIYLWKNEFNYLINLPITKAFGILSLGLIIISIFAYKPGESWLGLANFLPFFAFFIAFSGLINNLNQLRQLALCLVIPSPIISILGLGQLFLNWQTPPLFLGWELIAHGNPEGRMSSVFMYANILAIYLLISFTISLGLWLENYQFWRKNKLRFAWLTMGIILNSISLILTSSRNAWGIAFLAVLAYTIYLGWYYLVLAFTTAISIILGASFAPKPISNSLRYIVPKYFWGRLSDQMYPDRPLETLRITQWRFSLDLMIKDPLTGWGLRNFSPLYQEKMNIWLGHPHNFFLMLSAETGIILTLFFCSIIGYILAQTILLLKEIKPQNRLIVFTYLIAFSNGIFFNLFDVTIFDLRINTLTWLLLSGIYGIKLNLKYPEYNKI